MPCYYDRGHEDANPGPRRAAAGDRATEDPDPSSSSYTPTTSAELIIGNTLTTTTTAPQYPTYLAPGVVARPLTSPTFSIITPRTRSLASSPSSPRSTASTSAPTTLPVAPYAPYRHLELLILHNFTVHTCRALTGTDHPGLLDLWSVQVPKLAIAYEPLLNAMLAFSALHMLASPSATNAAALRPCRSASLDSAVTQYTATLRGSTPLSPQIADATCLTSVLLLADALASVRDRELEPYTPPINWLGIGRGVRLVFEKWAYELESTHPDAAVLTLFRESNELSTPSLIFIEAYMKRFPCLLAPRTADGLQLLNPTPETPEVENAYKNVSSYIGMLQTAIESTESRQSLVRRVIVFATIVPNPFIEQLEKMHPKAMVMLAYFWAMTARISLEAGGLWWAGLAPWKEVEAMRKNIPVAWQHLLEWPLQVLADVRAAEEKVQSPTR